MVIDDVFLEGIARLIDEVDMYFRVVRVDLAPAFVHGQEYRFNPRGGLCHETGRPRRGDGEASDVASSVFYHVFVQFRVCLAQAVDERVVLFRVRRRRFQMPRVLWPSVPMNGMPAGPRS